MMTFIFWLSLGIFVFSLVTTAGVIAGFRKIRHLGDACATPGTARPKVSIIVPALNEAQTIEPALASLLAIDYPLKEIIVVNDRSTDATPVILERLAKQHPGLRVLHITELPAGWLGKNHALHQGAQLASGDYLIFTDADVVFERSAIARAVNYCERHRVDHLALLCNVHANTQLLRMLLLSFMLALLARFQPWKVASSAKHYIGIGAFNMVRSSAYRKVGGHAAIPLAVIDDIMLGKLIKSGGFMQHALLATEFLSVEWYRSTPAMIKGLQKNIFAGFNYKISHLLAATCLMLLMRVWPWVGMIVASGITQLLNTATVFTSVFLFAYFARYYHWGYRCLWFAPIIALVEIYMWWRGSLLVLARGAIEWRGSRYPLEALKRSRL